MRALPLFLALVISAPAVAQTVTDGDTLRFPDKHVRLLGIDAPEIRQECNGWPAGIEASRKLRELIIGHEVVCENRGYDRYSRMIGLCRADGVDIQAAMVRAWRGCSSSTAATMSSRRQKPRPIG